MSAPAGQIVTIGNGESLWLASNGQYYTFGAPGTNCTISACPVELSVYGYRPTLAGSAAVIAIYTICMVFQVVLGVRYRTWGYMTAMVLGCVDEIIGYAARILMWQNPWTQTGFIMQIVLITIGPTFFAAAIYVMLFQIVKYISPEKCRFRPQLFYWAFIPCDIIALVLQAVGGAMSSISAGKSQTGIDIATAGLGFQVITLFSFAVAATDYALRSRDVWQKHGLSGRFKVFAAFLTLATVTIFVRCCYRLYELKDGYSSDSAPLRNQPFFIGLETCMVVIAAYSLIIAHPGPVFTRHIEYAPARKEYSTDEKSTTYINLDTE